MKKYKRNSSEKEYVPVNSLKYCGTYPIVCRSTWEEKFCKYLDFNKRVVEWSSEGTRISYFDPTKNKTRIYYPDFYAKFVDNKKYIIEVKPTKDLRLPKKKGKKSQKTMVVREQTYYVNQAKFKAAREYCKKMNMEFKIITERDLFRK